jgi:hypothetical protein
MRLSVPDKSIFWIPPAVKNVRLRPESAPSGVGGKKRVSAENAESWKQKKTD